MNDVAQIAAVVAAVAYLGAAPFGYWRPRGGSVIGMVGSSLPPLVALVAAAV